VLILSKDIKSFDLTGDTQNDNQPANQQKSTPEKEAPHVFLLLF
jgi:hypothetical protein